MSNSHLKSVFVALALVAGFTVAAEAQIPSTIGFQGLLTDENGVALPSGDYSISFRIYGAAEGGTALWTEVQSVEVLDGIANATLGRINPIDLSFDTQYWLGITIGQNPTELSPRMRMSAVAYSLTTKSIPDDVVTDDKLVDGAVTTAKLADDAVTSAKIADNAVSSDKIADGSIGAAKIADDAVETTKIPDGAVTRAKISPQGAQTGEALIMTSEGLDWGAPSGQGVLSEVEAGAGLAGGGTEGKVTLSVPNGGIESPMIANGAVGTQKLADAAVNTAQIANDAVTSVKIPVGGINLNRLNVSQADAGEFLSYNGTIPVWTAFSIENGSIGTAQLADGAVTGAKLFTTGATANEVLTYNGSNITWAPPPGAGAGSIGTTELADDAVTTPKVIDGAIDATKLADEAVTNAKLSDGAVGAAKLADGAVSAAKIEDGAVTTAKLVNGAISTQKLENAAVTTLKIQDQAVGTLQLADDAVTLDKINASAGSNAQVLTISGNSATWADPSGGVGPGSITETELADNSVSTAKIQTGAVTSAEIQDLQVGNGDLANGAVTNEKIAPASIDPLNKLSLAGAANGEFLVFNGGALDWTATVPGDLTITGDVTINGNISKGGGSFRIDHPLDPENKYLFHSFVESDDMMNIYSGNVQLDAEGRAVVELPDWFEPLNTDFRYQLTCIGGYAPVYVEQEIQDGRFSIAGGQPDLRVSWQITAVRDDTWARQNRIRVEVEKPAGERGTLLYPESQ